MGGLVFSRPWSHTRKRLDIRSPDIRAEVFHSSNSFVQGDIFNSGTKKMAIPISPQGLLGIRFICIQGRLLKVNAARKGVVCKHSKYFHTEDSPMGATLRTLL